MSAGRPHCFQCRYAVQCDAVLRNADVRTHWVQGFSFFPESLHVLADLYYIDSLFLSSGFSKSSCVFNPTTVLNETTRSDEGKVKSCAFLEIWHFQKSGQPQRPSWNIYICPFPPFIFINVKFNDRYSEICTCTSNSFALLCLMLPSAFPPCSSPHQNFFCKLQINEWMEAQIRMWH